MRILCYSTKPYDRQFLAPAAKQTGHEIHFIEPRLTLDTAKLAETYPAICVFVNDRVDAATLEQLSHGGTRAIALRCAGFNNVDLAAADRFGILVARVPFYSPYAVAEHAIGLILALNRKLHKAYNRVREQNFSLDGLLGFDIHGRTIGLIGTGAIGTATARILAGFGCKLLFDDPYPNDTCRALGTYVNRDELLQQSDIVSLHCPLNPNTHHVIDADALNQLKHGAMLINTSRGALVDTAAAIDALKSRRLGAMALDVYEEEEGLFFQDLSNQIVHDDVFARLLTFPNVLITAHQAFFTSDALESIATTTMRNLSQIERGEPVANRVGVTL
jgi:D-lactate dehydrogenase